MKDFDFGFWMGIATVALIIGAPVLGLLGVIPMSFFGA